MAQANTGWDPRSAVVGVTLPISVLVFALAWYSLRSIRYLLVMNFNEGAGAMASTYSLEWLGTLIGCVLAAGVGALLGPWAIAALGLLVVGLGAQFLAVSPFETLSVAFMVLSMGGAMVNVGLTCAALDGLRRRHAGGLIAVLAAMYAARNLGAFAGGQATSIVPAAGAGGVMVFALLCLAVTLLFVIVAGAAWHVLNRRYHRVEGRYTLSLKPSLTAVAVFVVLAPCVAAMWVGLETVIAVSYDFGMLQPLAVVVLCVPVMVVGALIAWLRRSPPILLLTAAGLLLATVALVVRLGVPPSGVGLLLGAMGLITLAEVLVGTWMTAAWARGLHWRMVPLFVALWVGTTALTVQAGLWWVYQDGGIGGVILWALPAMTLFGAVLAAIAAIPIRRRVWRTVS